MSSKTFISYEVLALMLIIMCSLVVDYYVFQGDVLIKPIFGPGAVDQIHYINDHMGTDLKIYIVSMISFIILCLILVLYYLYQNS